MPKRNHPLTDQHRAELKRDYDAICAPSFSHVFAFPMDPAGRISADVTDDADIHQIFERGWEDGGFRYIFTTFDDMLVGPRCAT